MEEVAAEVGGTTLLDDPEWMTTFSKAICNPDVRFTLSLDGMEGDTVMGRLMRAAQAGAQPDASPLNWEVAQLYDAGRLGEVTLVEQDGAVVVPNPMGG